MGAAKSRIDLVTLPVVKFVKFVSIEIPLDLLLKCFVKIKFIYIIN